MTLTMLAMWLLPLAAPNPSAWELVNEEDKGTKIWARDVPGKRVREVKAETIIDAPTKRVFATIQDVPHYTEFMPYVIEATVLKPVGKNGRIIYQRIDPPLVDMRDYTLHMQWEAYPDTGVYLRHWKLANEHGPPPKEDTVRVEVCEGSWTLEPLPGDKTRVTYWLYTDPGGNIPLWIANKANTSSLPDLLAAVRNRTIDPKWRRDD